MRVTSVRILALLGMVLTFQSCSDEGAHQQTISSSPPCPATAMQFSWQYNETEAVMLETEQVLHQFVTTVDRDFLPLECDRVVKIVMFQDSAIYLQQMWRHFPGLEIGRFGTIVGAATIYTHTTSGIGTLSHLALPLFLKREDQYGSALRERLPAWVISGLRTYFEKFYGYWTTGTEGQRQVVFEFGFQNPWRTQALGLGARWLDAMSVIRAEHGERYSSYQTKTRSLIMFIHHEGKIDRFFELLRTRNRMGFQTYFEAAIGESYQDFKPRWQAYLVDVMQSFGSFRRMPGSQIYPDQQTYSTNLPFLHR